MNFTIADMYDLNALVRATFNQDQCRRQTENQTKESAEPIDFVTTIVTNDDGSASISIEVPGVLKEDVVVTTEASKLEVTVSKKLNKPVKFVKSWEVPNIYDLPKTASVLVNGILTIQVPRSKTSLKRTVNIL